MYKNLTQFTTTQLSLLRLWSSEPNMCYGYNISETYPKLSICDVDSKLGRTMLNPKTPKLLYPLAQRTNPQLTYETRQSQ